MNDNNDTKEAMQVWLRDVQATKLPVDQVMNPARVAVAVGDVVKSSGGGQLFDSEPAQYYKLLRDIAHQNATKDQ